MTRPFLNTGYRPPIASDKRNFTLEKTQPIQPFPAMFITDITKIPVFMQEQIPDCVENAVTFVKKFHEWKKTETVFDLSRRSLVIPTVQRDGFPLSEGTSIENALYVAYKSGIAESNLVPDDHTLDLTTFDNPAVMTPSAVANAMTHQIYSYAFVTDKSSNGLKNAIYQNGVVIVGGTIDDNWWTAPNGTVSWSKADIDPIRPPAANSTSKSNHAFVLYGYDEGGFYFRNSFSADWADGGNNYIPNSAFGILYEAATIVDLTDAQIQALKDAQNAANTVENTIHSLPPAVASNPQVIAILINAVKLISNYLKSFFS